MSLNSGHQRAYFSDDMRAWRAMVEPYRQGKTEEIAEETCPSATLSTTNTTRTDPGVNLGLRN
jgi:hypothetical protein